MTNPPSPPPQIPSRSLPTGRLLIVAWLYAIVAGAGWTLAMVAHTSRMPPAAESQSAASADAETAGSTPSANAADTATNAPSASPRASAARLIATGPLAALLVGLGATCGILAMQPWRPRSVATWPMVWMAGSMVRFMVTLGGAFLLYSATPSGTVHLWIGVVIAYLATLVGETRTYAAAMRPVVAGRGSDTA
jgi:hypothetical protein